MNTKVPSFVCGSNIYCNSQGCSCQKNHAQSKMNPLDPTQPDPRQGLWGNAQAQQCCVPPFEKPLPPPCYHMKLRQLEDCYMGQQSDACRRRRTNFYKRWQHYLDRLPPYPGYDYKTYCCDDYVDVSHNCDFVQFKYYKPNLKGPRETARTQFLLPRLLGESLAEQEADRSKCADVTSSPEFCLSGRNRTMTQGFQSDVKERVKLYQEEPHTIWRQFQGVPVPNVGFVYGCTPIKSRIHPFTKDASFSTPVGQFSTGNDSPFKEFRDLKMV